MIKIEDKNLVLEDFYKIIFDEEPVNVCPDLKEKVKTAYKFLKDFSVNKTIYGVNTGLGPMAQYEIDPEEQIKLQCNLIRSHAAGLGKALSEKCVKAALIARLRSLSLGRSAIHIDVINLLESLINNNIIPYVPEHGGVGASGDLVQLSHIALAMLGEGEVYYKGTLQPTESVFKALGLHPLKCRLREGLGLINGTSVMTGIGVINVIRARNLVNWSVVASSLINEIVKSFDDHISFKLNSTKQHLGQQIIAKAMREFVEGSRLIKRRQDNSYKIENGDKKVFEQKVQEYYSLRCVPQILGPVYETIENAARILTEEVNSVNDNPIVDVESKQVYHGGNFHGDYVSFEMDKLKIAITKLSILAERQINFLMNNKLNEILPPFVNLGVLGLNLGLQGIQFTATSTVAENQTLSNPMYIHSIPNNGDNQDVVSMGTNAALMSRKVIYNTYEVLAVEFLSLAYAIEYLGFEEQLSASSRYYFNKIKKIITISANDTIKYKDLNSIREYLQNNRPDLIGKV